MKYATVYDVEEDSWVSGLAVCDDCSEPYEDNSDAFIIIDDDANEGECWLCNKTYNEEKAESRVI